MPIDQLPHLVPLAASCSDPLSCWGKGDFFQAMNLRVAAVMGLAAFMLIVGVPLYLALQYWSKNYTVPAVVLVLSGGAIMSLFPPVVARIGWIIILLAGALGLFGLLWAVIR